MNNLRLSADKIRSIKELKQLTDEQVEEIADFLSLFAIITYNNLANK